MRVIILVSLSAGIKAAAMIKDALIRKGHEVDMVDENKTTRHYYHKADIVLRWGTHRAFPLNGATEINTKDAVIQAENKAYSRYIMQDRGLPVPKTWYSISAAELPFIVRPESHSLGRQFRIVEKVSDKKFHEHVKNLYCSAIFPKVSEYRVHTWRGQPFSMWNKNITKGELLANQAHTHRPWTHINKPYQSELHERLANEAVRACELFGLETGGVDIMVDANDNLAICEINTMPQIKSQFLADLYADQIIKTVQNG